MKDFNYDYIAFLPMGVAFITLGITMDDMFVYTAIGFMFLTLFVSLGLTTKGENDGQDNISSDDTNTEETSEHTNSNENETGKNNLDKKPSADELKDQ